MPHTGQQQGKRQTPVEEYDHDEAYFNMLANGERSKKFRQRCLFWGLLIPILASAALCSLAAFNPH